MAPVVACLRDDRDGLQVLLDGVRERHAVADVVRAAPESHRSTCSWRRRPMVQSTS